MGNYTPGTIKARGGPPRGLIFNLRGYRAPCIMRPQPWPGILPAGGLIPCRYNWPYPCSKLAVVPMGKLGVVSSLVLPWFGRCVSVAVRLLIRSAAPPFMGVAFVAFLTGSPRVHALLLGVCFVRFVCGSYDGAGRSCFPPEKILFCPLQCAGVAVHEGGQGGKLPPKL